MVYYTKTYILYFYFLISYSCFLLALPGLGENIFSIRNYFLSLIGYDVLPVFVKLVFISFIFFLVQMLIDIIVIRICNRQKLKCHFEFYQTLVYFILVVVTVNYFYLNTVEFPEKKLIWFILYSIPFLQLCLTPTVFINQNQTVTLIHPFSLISTFASDNAKSTSGKIYFYKNKNTIKPMTVLKWTNVSFVRDIGFEKKMNELFRA